VASSVGLGHVGVFQGNTNEKLIITILIKFHARGLFFLWSLSHGFDVLQLFSEHYRTETNTEDTDVDTLLQE